MPQWVPKWIEFIYLILTDFTRYRGVMYELIIGQCVQTPARKLLLRYYLTKLGAKETLDENVKVTIHPPTMLSQKSPHQITLKRISADHPYRMFVGSVSDLGELNACYSVPLDHVKRRKYFYSLDIGIPKHLRKNVYYILFAEFNGAELVITQYYIRHSDRASYNWVRQKQSAFTLTTSHSLPAFNKESFDV